MYKYLYFKVKFYETVRPVQTECDQLRLRNTTLEAEVRSMSKQISELQGVNIFLFISIISWCQI